MGQPPVCDGLLIPQPPVDVVFFQDTTAQICYPDRHRDDATARGRAMGNQAHAQFTVAGWEEQTWDGQPAREVRGAKLTQAEVT